MSLKKSRGTVFRGALTALVTPFTEAGAVDRRALTWIHKFFFIDRQKGSRFLAEEYARMTADENLSKRLRETILRGGNVEYEAKKILKEHETTPLDKDVAAGLTEVIKEARKDFGLE